MFIPVISKVKNASDLFVTWHEPNNNPRALGQCCTNGRSVIHYVMFNGVYMLFCATVCDFSALFLLSWVCSVVKLFQRHDWVPTFNCCHLARYFRDSLFPPGMDVLKIRYIWKSFYLWWKWCSPSPPLSHVQISRAVEWVNLMICVTFFINYFLYHRVDIPVCCAGLYFNSYLKANLRISFFNVFFSSDITWIYCK